MAASKVVLNDSPWGRALNKMIIQLSPGDLDILLADNTFKVQTSTSLVDSIKNLVAGYEKGWLQTISAKVIPFLSHIASFSSIISVYTQADPSFSSLLWGSVYLLISVACRSRATLEKIIDMLGDLSRNLPLFRRWAVLYPEKDYSELSTTLESAYLELIDFCINAVKYFRRGRVVNLLRVAFLPSFEAGFRRQVCRMQKQTESVRLEVESAFMHDTKKEFSTMRGLIKAIPSRSGSISTLQHLRMIPHSQNARFYGREDVLSLIDSVLSPLRKTNKLRSFALFGIGGSGKTQIALEYAYRHLKDFKAIFWIVSDSFEKIEQGFVEAAALLGLDHDTIHANQARHDVLHWLSASEDEYLLVFDNADNVALLADYWPRSDHGSVLITSRDSVMSEELAVAGERVAEFSVDEGCNFLEAQLPDSIIRDAHHKIRQISAIFHGFPLALGLASAFIRTQCCQLEEFIRIINDDKNLDVINSMPVAGYAWTLSTVWKLSLSSLDASARTILEILVYLDPDSIPNELFQKGHPNCSSTDPLAFLSNPLKFFAATTALRQRSLIRTNSDRDTISIHRYFQVSAFRQIRENPGVRRQSFEYALSLLCNMQPEDNTKQHWSPQCWEPTQRYLPHIKTLESRFLESPASFKGSETKLARLLFHCSNYLFERNRYNAGLTTITTARQIAQLVDPVNAQLLSDLWRLEGRLCNESNQALRAAECFKSAEHWADEAISTQGMDMDDTRLARILTGWGNCLNHLGMFDEALDLQLRAMKFCANNPGKHGDAILIVKLNLGYVLLRKGLVEEAERMFEETLSVDRKSQPLMYALGNIAISQGRFDDGLFLHSEALRLYSAHFGEQHHLVADSTYKVGETLLRMGRLKEAEILLRRSLAIYLSEGQHFDARAAIARSARMLACALEQLECLGEASTHYKLAWRMRKEVTGVEGTPDDKDEDYAKMMFYWSA